MTKCLPYNESGTKRPKAHEMLRATQKGVGKAGSVDGWTGEEVSMIPAAAWKDFLQISERWERLGMVPQVVRTSRMVNIPKEAKVKEGCVKPEDTRPLSIYSAVWRTYLSAWYGKPTM